MPRKPFPPKQKKIVLTPVAPPAKTPKVGKTEPRNDGTVRLNKYIAQSGICSRRAADELIANGQVTVNGQVVTEMGHRLQPLDVVVYKGKLVEPKQNFVYILLNKPKNYITTNDDELSRLTVMDLVKDATNERIYPVGRLDRKTTGLLLLTNDGALAQKLTHPSYEIKKVYYLLLDRKVKEEDLEKIRNTITLEDGPVPVDDVAYVDNIPGPEVGIEIHIGRNRIVRRLFEHLGYTVERLDRVLYGPLNLNKVPRGRWRHLTEKEVNMLKHY